VKVFSQGDTAEARLPLELDEWKSKIQSFAKHLSGDGGGSQVHAALPSRNRAEWRKEEKE